MYVRTRQSADCGSDHQLLVANIKLKLKARKKENPPVRYDVEEIPQQYSVLVRNKFQVLLTEMDEDRTPNELWDEMKEAVISSAKETIPRKKKKKQPWISKTTLDLADKRQEAKKKGDYQEWKKQQKEVSKSVRTDQRNFVERKCDEIEKARNDSRKVFSLVKELTQKSSTRSDVINDRTGNTLTESADIKNRWAEYCTDLYQDDPQETSSSSSNREEEQEPPPLLGEVRQAMSEINDGKSPGIDQIPSELWKASGDEGVQVMWKLCVKIWRDGQWPTDWGRAVFIPLPKKGNIKECSNHRTISLICHASKILLKIINNRMKRKLENEIAEEQAGFRAGRGTRDHIVNIRNIIEKCRGHATPLYLCFIDYSKAFDCVSHKELWNIMRDMGFPTHVVELISKLYEDQESAVRTSRGDTDWFEIGRGVRQGCILSPQLFNLYAEAIMREALEDFPGGVKIGGRRITNLRYADDTTLVCGSKKELLDLLKAVKSASERRGLLLNTKKTKIMVIDDDRKDQDEGFVLDGNNIDEVESFEFLGSVINTKGDCSQEIKRRLAMAKSVVHKLTKLWKSRLPISLKLRLLKSTAFAVASYGSESWTMKSVDRKKVDSFELWCYRRVLRIPWTHRKTNQWVLEQLGVKKSLRADMICRKLTYFGHIMRHNSFEKNIIEGMMENKRRRGRPAASWLNDMKDISGTNVTMATRIAADRTRWRALVETTPVYVYTM